MAKVSELDFNTLSKKEHTLSYLWEIIKLNTKCTLLVCAQPGMVIL